MRKLSIFMGVFLLLFSTAAYADDVKIAVFDFDKVARECDAMKSGDASFAASIKKTKNEVEAERKTLEKEASVLTDPKATDKQRKDFIVKQTAFMQKTNKLMQEVNEADLKIRNVISNVIFTAADNLAKSNSYTAVIDRNAFLFPRPSQVTFTDVTSDMLQEANKVWKSGGGK